VPQPVPNLVRERPPALSSRGLADAAEWIGC